MPEWSTINEPCDIVRETSFAIPRYLRYGHLEKVYERALVHRLTQQGIRVEAQNPVPVIDEDGTPLGEYYADLFVEGVLLVELTATKSIADEQVSQLLGYLRATRIEHGLLINFGAPKLYIKKYILDRLD